MYSILRACVLGALTGAAGGLRAGAGDKDRYAGGGDPGKGGGNETGEERLHTQGFDPADPRVLALCRRAGELGIVVLMSDNIHFDLSGTIVLAADSPVEDEFVWTLRNVGIDNVLLGSDFPQITLGQTLEALDKLDFTHEEKRKIRWENAQRIFPAARKE